MIVIIKLQYKNDIVLGEDDRQTPLNDENNEEPEDKKSSRSPSPIGGDTASGEPKSDPREPHDRTPSLSPEPEPEIKRKPEREVRGDSKHSSRDYEQTRFFDPRDPRSRGSRPRSRSPPAPQSLRDQDHIRSSRSRDPDHMRPRSRDREHGLRR